MSFWPNTGRLPRPSPTTPPTAAAGVTGAGTPNGRSGPWRRRWSGRRKKPATGPATIAMARASSPFPWRQSSRALAAEAEEALYQEEAVRRRHRNSRSRNRSNPHPHPEKPNRTKPGEERKGRSHWHKKGHRKSGGGTPPLRAEFLPTSAVWKAIRPLCAGWLPVYGGVFPCKPNLPKQNRPSPPSRPRAWPCGSPWSVWR